MKIFPHRYAQEDDVLNEVMNEIRNDSEDYLYAVSWDKDMSIDMQSQIAGKGWGVEYKTFPNATMFRVKKDMTFCLPFNSDGPYLKDSLGNISMLRPLKFMDLLTDNEEIWKPVP